jgi:hypothetical protein
MRKMGEPFCELARGPNPAGLGAGDEYLIAHHRKGDIS